MPDDALSADGQPTRLTDEQVAKGANVAFRQVEQLRDAVPLLGSPHRGSPLWGDDRATDMHKTSHYTVAALQAAVEHLDALRILIEVGLTIHPSAPFTLARAAIETASTAVWLLAPPDRPTRVTRTLQVAARDVMDSHTATTGTPLVQPRTLEERRAQIDAIAAAAVGATSRVQPATSTAIVTAAEEAGVSSMRVLLMWRLCSGFAHGRRWATLAFLDQEVFPGAVESDVNLKVTSSLDRVLSATWVATDVTSHAVDLYRLRAESPYGRSSVPDVIPSGSDIGDRTPIGHRRSDTCSARGPYG